MITTNNKLDTFDYLWENGVITSDHIEQAEEIAKEKKKQHEIVPIEDILHTVTKCYSLERHDLIGRSKLRHVVNARYMFIYLCKEAGHSTYAIAMQTDIGRITIDRATEIIDKAITPGAIEYDKYLEGWYRLFRGFIYGV